MFINSFNRNKMSIFFSHAQILTKDRKKSGHVSLSHLLNFTVTPRERNPSFNNGGGGGNGYRKTRRQSNYNKEQFLLAK